jgi:hypothetical protein
MDKHLDLLHLTPHLPILKAASLGLLRGYDRNLTAGVLARSLRTTSEEL